MRVLAKFVLAFGFLLGLSLQAQAGPLLTSVINPTPGQQSSLNDASISQVFTSTGTPLGPNDAIVAGDIVVGVLRINNAITPPATTFTSTQQLAAIFSFQIATQTLTTGPGGTTDIYTQTVNATPASSGKTIDQLLSSPAGSKFPAGTFSNNTVVALLENGNAPNPTTSGTLATVQSALATTYTLDQSMGFVTNQDQFAGQITVPHGTPLTPAALAALGSISPFGQDEGTFSHILNPQGLGNYVGVPITDTLVTGKTFTSDWGFSAQLVGPTAAQIANGFDVGDHSIITVNAVATPEPSTCTLLLLGSIGFGFVARRRRNRQATA